MNYVAPEGEGDMVIFVSNCGDNLGGVGFIALLQCSRDLFKCIFSCNCISVERRIQRCLCMYAGAWPVL